MRWHRKEPTVDEARKVIQDDERRQIMAMFPDEGWVSPIHYKGLKAYVKWYPDGRWEWADRRDEVTR